MLTLRSKDGAYHHGDLRAASITAARMFVTERGIHALSMRKLADALGVTAAALYRHFDGMNALQAVVAEQFREELGEHMLAARQAVPTTNDPHHDAVLRFHAIGDSYIEFAYRNSRLFETAFLFRDHQSTNEQGLAYRLLLESLVELGELGMLVPQVQEEACLLAWSSVHGFATLVAQQAFAHDEYHQWKRLVLVGVGRAITGTVIVN